MSTRFVLALSLAAALSSFVSGSAVAERAFSQPPQSAQRVAPHDAMDEEMVVDRAVVRSALANARAKNLAEFVAYQKAGVFPSNTHKEGLTNVWRDKAGHLCAAANLVLKSGNRALVDKVAEQTNFLKLADVKQGPVMDWMLTSGFTQEELVAIQRPYRPVSRQVDPVDVDIAVDPDLKAQENARLAKLYKGVEKELVANEKASLDAATDRLMKHPDLAYSLVYSRL
jgi:hypothetical protein